MKKLLLYFFLILLLACTEYTPRPIGYNRIEIPAHSYLEFENPVFSFLYSEYAYIDSIHTEKDTEKWFNIVYPALNARIYCSYISVSRSGLRQALEDSYHLAYSHAVKADDIRQIVYNNPFNKVSGMLYEIEGNVPTPIQFFLTDSIANFFRASLYYDTQVKEDSVAPVTEFIREDILQLIDSFTWK